MRCNYCMLYQVSPPSKEQEIEKQRKDRNENKDKGFRKNIGPCIVFLLQSVITDLLLLQFLVDLQIGVSGVVVVHVKLGVERRSESGSKKQCDREVIDDVEDDEQLQRFNVADSASTKILAT